MFTNFLIIILGVFVAFATASSSESSVASSSSLATSTSVKIEGRIVEPENGTNSVDFVTWLHDVHVQLDGGQYVAHPRIDGSFEFLDMAAGSYLLEVVNPSLAFEKVRIEINSNGKIRARAANPLKPSEVKIVNYPLKLKSEGHWQYFQRREEWRITDLLMNPMVLMMVVPLLLFMVMPKVQPDDPEVKQVQNMLNPTQRMPELSEMLTRGFGAFGGGDQAPQQRGRRAGVGAAIDSPPESGEAPRQRRPGKRT